MGLRKEIPSFKEYKEFYQNPEFQEYKEFYQNHTQDQLVKEKVLAGAIG